MKLYFMKQSAIEYIKANISTLYVNYYKYDTCEWIEDLFDYNPFEVFKEVPDFELASLDLQPGEIDLQNCKILFEKIDGLSESNAADERLWAGLCNKTFYSYLRKRLELAKKHLRKASDDSQTILMRYFYRSSGRSGMFRNSLARCWWTGRLAYSPDSINKWELLDAVGPEDFISKMSDIFYSNTYSSNSEIVEGFCKGLKFFREHGIQINNRDHIRPTAQFLNAIGGSVLLDMLSSDEIKVLVVDRIDALRKGESIGISTIEQDASDDDPIDDEPSNNELEDTFEVTAEYNGDGNSDDIKPSIDLDKVLGEMTKVDYGCSFVVEELSSGKVRTIQVPLSNKEMPYMAKFFLGKVLGEVIKIGSIEYCVKQIVRKMEKDD